MIENCKSKINEIINKAKVKLNECVLEYNVYNSFKNKNILFSLYEKNSLLNKKVYGFYLDNNVIVYGNYEINDYALLINEKNKNIYNIRKSKSTNINILCDGEQYIRQGTLFYLDTNIKEVDAIKIGKKFYIKNLENKDL